MGGYQWRAEVGDLLRRHRLAAKRSLASVARVSGVGTALVGQVERASVAADLDLIEQLFAALDLRLRLGVESVSADCDRELDRLARHPAARRLLEWEWLLGQLDGVGGVVDGPVAALVQGVPLPADTLDLAVTHDQLESLGHWLLRHGALRWSERWEDYRLINPDPAVPGPLQWRVGVSDIRAHVGRELPAAVRVRCRDRDYRVRPLAEIELDDPRAAGLLRRWRDR